MTTFETSRTRNRDSQDAIERHVWGKQKYIDGAGSILTIRGTGTQDEEVVVLNGGYSFNLPENSDAEVISLAGGFDTNLKFALPQIPHDKQRQWAEGTGGIQHPMDGNRAIEFNGSETWLKDGTFVLGHDKGVKITVSGGTATIECENLDIKSATLTHNGVSISDTHRHIGVDPGPGTSGPPEA